MKTAIYTALWPLPSFTYNKQCTQWIGSYHHTVYYFPHSILFFMYLDSLHIHHFNGYVIFHQADET